MEKEIRKPKFLMKLLRKKFLAKESPYYYQLKFKGFPANPLPAERSIPNEMRDTNEVSATRVAHGCDTWGA